MTDRAELKEKVVAAIRDAWNNASNDGNPISYYLADAAIAVALEEAARVCEERGHAEAERCAAAIRALIPKEKPHE